jgi:uncharacterized protein YggU (UPF0235/DUF167 family)
MPARPSTVPWSATASGIVIAVRLTPKGGRDSIDGIEALSDGRFVLKARVRALPSEGEANAALVKLIARTLDVPNRAVALAGGATSRVKRITVEGDAPALIARLEKFASPR